MAKAKKQNKVVDVNSLVEETGNEPEIIDPEVQNLMGFGFSKIEAEAALVAVRLARVNEQAEAIRVFKGTVAEAVETFPSIVSMKLNDLATILGGGKGKGKGKVAVPAKKRAPRLSAEERGAQVSKLFTFIEENPGVSMAGIKAGLDFDPKAAMIVLRKEGHVTGTGDKRSMTYKIS